MGHGAAPRVAAIVLITVLGNGVDGNAIVAGAERLPPILRGGLRRSRGAVQCQGDAHDQRRREAEPDPQLPGSGCHEIPVKLDARHAS